MTKDRNKIPVNTV